jgi:uncharacterized protein YegL
VNCALALILLLDSSGSINGAAWQTMVEAHADALADERIAHAMSAQGLTTVSVIVYDDTPRVVVPWRIVDVPEDAAAVAREVAGIRRPSNGSTQTGAALSFALRHFDAAPCEGERRVVDLVTDGPADDERRVAEAREAMIEADVRLNVLAVQTYGVDAAAWAREFAVTPGGFVMETPSWQEFAHALRRKLTWEISQR